MADISSGTPEAIAMELLEKVAAVESKNFHTADRAKAADRKWILDTYAECIFTVKAPNARINP